MGKHEHRVGEVVHLYMAGLTEKGPRRENMNIVWEKVYFCTWLKSLKHLQDWKTLNIIGVEVVDLNAAGLTPKPPKW